MGTYSILKKDKKSIYFLEEKMFWLSVTWLKNKKKKKEKEEGKKSYCVQLISNSSHLQMIPAASNFCQNAFC